MADSKAAVPAFPRPDTQYSQVNEAQFRRDVERFMQEVASYPASLLGLVTHVSTHETGGDDPIDHGSIDGRGDDDHALYLLHAGSRNWSGHLLTGANSTYNIGVTGGEIAELWVDALKSEGEITITPANKLVMADGKAIEVDHINEATAAGGVTIEGITFKDGCVNEDFKPISDSGLDLGATGACFAEVWADKIDSDNAVTINAVGTLDLSIAGTTVAQIAADKLIMTDGDSIEVDIINEATAAAGVTIEGLTIKDGAFNEDVLPISDSSLDLGSTAKVWAELWVDKITSDNAMEIDAASTLDLKVSTTTVVQIAADKLIMTDGDSIEVDHINEAASAHGVNIDGVLVKDNRIAANYISAQTFPAGNFTFTDGLVTIKHPHSGEPTLRLENLTHGDVTGAHIRFKAEDASGDEAHGDYGFSNPGPSTEQGQFYWELVWNAGQPYDMTLDASGLTLLDGMTLEVDTINEATAAAGVTIEGTLLKDNNIEPSADSADLIGKTAGVWAELWVDKITSDNAMEIDAASTLDLKVATTTVAQIAADKLIMTDGDSIEVDIINEATNAVGVTIDSVLLQDNDVVLVDGGAVHGLINDTGGIGISGGSGITAGANIYMYGGTEASTPCDFLFRADNTTKLQYDHSESLWIFADGQGMQIDIIDEATANAGVTIEGTLLKDNNIEPSADSADLIGKTGGVWAEVWTDALKSDGAITCTPALTVTGHLTLNAPAAPWNTHASGLVVTNNNDTDYALYFGQCGASATQLRIVPYDAKGAGLLWANDFYFDFDNARWMFDGTLALEDGLKVNGITEFTGAAGVTIEGITFKDGAVNEDFLPISDSGLDLGSTAKVWAELWVDKITSDNAMEIDAASTLDLKVATTTVVQIAADKLIMTDGDSIEVDIINEATGAAGVTIDGVQIKDSVVLVDTISEATGGVGVTIDGVLLQDNKIAASYITPGTCGEGVWIFDGDINVGANDAGEDISVRITGPAAQARKLRFETSGSKRWLIEADNAAEGGSNAGSDLDIVAYADNGVAIESALKFTRATGDATFGHDIFPDADSANDLGKTGAVWAEVWTDALKSDGTITTDANFSVVKDSPVLTIDAGGGTDPAILKLDAGASGGGGGQTGCPTIEFDGRELCVFDHQDSALTVFGFYAGFASARTNDADLRVFGSAASSWGTYIGLKHDGTNGLLTTDVGDIYLTPNGGDVILNAANLAVSNDSTQTIGASTKVFAELWVDKLESDGVISMGVTLNMVAEDLQFAGTQAVLAATADAGGDGYDGINLDTADGDTAAPLAAVVISTDAASGDYPYGTIWCRYTA